MERDALSASPGEGTRDEVDRLNERARSGLATELARALEEAYRAAGLAASIGYAAGRARALRTAGECHDRLADAGAARGAFLEAIALFAAERDTAGEADARHALGAVEYRGARYPESLEQFGLALSLARAANDRLLEASALTGLAATAYSVGDYRRAADAYLDALAIERATRDRAAQAGCPDDVRKRELQKANAVLRLANDEKARLLEALRAKEGELERASRTDPLTGLANRRSLEKDLELRFQEARRYGRELALALIDIDHFKKVNDTARSHKTGDEVLRMLATILCAESRNVDLVARWGGEEFAICLPQTTREAAVAACERIREVVEATEWSRIHPGITVTVSIGLAGSGEAGSPDDLVFVADERLYEAKEEGRNQVCW